VTRGFGTQANIAAANATVRKSSAEVAELKASIAAADAFQAWGDSEFLRQTSNVRFL